MVFNKKNYKLKVLSNFDIIDMMNNRDNPKSKFIGVFSRDGLPKKLNNNESLILNLDSEMGNGTHWVSIYNDPNQKYVEYFDSYGLPPPEEAIEYMKTTKKPIYYNTNQMQAINNIMCGFYSIYYINERENGKPMYNIIYGSGIIKDGIDFEIKPDKFLTDYFNMKI